MALFCWRPGGGFRRLDLVWLTGWTQCHIMKRARMNHFWFKKEHGVMILLYCRKFMGKIYQGGFSFSLFFLFFFRWPDFYSLSLWSESWCDVRFSLLVSVYCPLLLLALALTSCWHWGCFRMLFHWQFQLHIHQTHLFVFPLTFLLKDFFFNIWRSWINVVN